MSRYTCILASIGVVLSTYALYVEHRMSHPSMDADDEAEEFVALCDIDAIGASCRYVMLLLYVTLTFSVAIVILFIHIPNLPTYLPTATIHSLLRLHLILYLFTFSPFHLFTSHPPI